MAAFSAGLKVASEAAKKNLAIMVVHGIGEQNPYETLDGFARGLDQYYRDNYQANSTLRPERIDYSQASRMCVHLEPPTAAGSVWRRISLFEYYWAPETEDKITYRESLLFLIRTGLSPLRKLSVNLQEISQAGKKRTILRALGIFVREIVRAVLIFIPLIFALGALLWWLTNPPSLSGARALFEQFLHSAPWWVTGIFSLCSTLAVVMATFLVQQAWSLLRRKGTSTEKYAEWSWVALAVLVLVLALGTAEWMWSSHFDLSKAVTNLIWNRQVLALVATLAVAYVVRGILTGFVGDIAVYVTADEKSKNYAARRAILKGSCELVHDLLRSDDYDHVIIAGHSLGSVIAYDTVNKLIGEVATRYAGPKAHNTLTEKHLAKLSGLLTFGSPLDKIYYFFREQVEKDQAIRAQLVSYIHPFRRKSSGRNYKPFELTKPALPVMKVRWLNVWSPFDPVSGHLDFYEADDQNSLWYWIPGAAHLSYWRDQRFYTLLVKTLIDRVEVGAAKPPE
jgi:hypothetical protein